MIGTLDLVPAFDGSVTSYSATTANATNVITVTPLKAGAKVEIKVNGAAHTNKAAATWLTGKNTVTIKVAFGTTVKTYTVIVTKTGNLGSLTVASVAGAEVGDTAITVTEALTGGCKYKYMTDTSVELPTLDDDLSEWVDWDGEADITATTGDDIVIAEVSIFDNLAKKAGKTTVAAKA